MNCPKCKQPVAANARFCGSCGQSIDLGAAASAAPAVAVGAAAGGAYAAASTVWTAPSAAMPGLLGRIKNIILSPKSEWPVIAPEPTTISQLFVGYVMPVAAFVAVIGLIRVSWLGVHLPFGAVTYSPLASGLLYMVSVFVLCLVGLFLEGLIINALAPTFAGRRDQRQALKVAAYAFTPAWLSSVLALSPILPTLLQLAALIYGIYVFYLGLPVLMQSPREKALGYTVTVLLCNILLGIVLMGVSVIFHLGGAHALANLSPAEATAAREQGATAVGNAIGNVLGTDDKGKSGLSAALSNLAKAGEQSQAQSAPSNTVNSAATSTADSNPSPASAVGGLLTALGGSLGGSHRVDTVDFKTLTGLLPSALPGMKRTDAGGENQGAIGVKTSSAKADYVGSGGAKVKIEIADVSAVSGLLDLAGGLVQNTTSESDSGYERDVVIGGRPVHEKFDAKNRNGELSVLLAKRYSVDISGDSVDMNALEQSLGQIDLARLESMKDAGAQ